MPSIQNRRYVSMTTAAASRRTNCRHNRDDRVSGPVRTVVDDSESLAITALTCSGCGRLIEALHLLSRDGTAKPYQMLAVASRVQPRRSVALSVLRSATGMVTTSGTAV